MTSLTKIPPLDFTPKRSRSKARIVQTFMVVNSQAQQREKNFLESTATTMTANEFDLNSLHTAMMCITNNHSTKMDL